MQTSKKIMSTRCFCFPSKNASCFNFLFITAMNKVREVLKSATNDQRVIIVVQLSSEFVFPRHHRKL